MKQKQFNRVMWGFIWIIVAIIIFGKVFSWWDFSLIEGKWGLVPITVFAVAMIGNKFSVISTTGFFISLIIYFNSRGIENNISVKGIVTSVCLLIIGLNLLIRGLITASRRNIELYKKEDYYGTSFGSVEAVPHQKEFKGCRVDAIFGGTTLDLRDVILSGNVQIDTTTLFGSVHIIAPKGVRIKKNAVTIFGNVSDQRGYVSQDGELTIYLNGICMFGGVEIR